MDTTVRHIALVVPDLRAAEVYYRSVFDMELIGREAELEDGQWYTLPFDKDWDDARTAGIDLDMVALRKGGFVLALFGGDAPPGQVYVIGLRMPPEEMAGVRARLAEHGQASQGSPENLEFSDPYQIIWQISVPGSEFDTSGVLANRWIKL